MKKKSLICFCIAILSVSCTQKRVYRTLDGVAQGSTYHIVFEAVNVSDSAFMAVRDSVALYLTQIDYALSGYNKSSILTAFNENKTIREDKLLYKIFLDNFLISKEMALHSNGLLDVSAAPLFDLWGFGFKEGRKVTDSQIDSVMKFIGISHFTLINEGTDSAKIIKDDPRCRLNFNAIAQGYTADYIARKFDSMKIENYIIEIGGEIYAKGLNSKGLEWRVGIDKPLDGNNAPGENMQAIVKLSNKALVTSGDYRKFYVKNGKKISHTINPKTGYPVEHNLLSATVVASCSAKADAYATLLMVVGLEKAKEIVTKTEGIEAFLVYGEQDSMHTWASDGMNLLLLRENN